MYQVLARKFRPRNFDELVGQQHVSRTLVNAIAADRLAHAYIFAGQRGTGKTTVARILAKCLNCEKGPTSTPCDECAPCQEIAASRAMDVFEIDAASRTKVEQTRELLEMVSYAPVRDRHKIIIIDEVHMLSTASFNALLKTLEEPPPNVVFILATTEMQKILPTILSRCQVFEFRRVPVKQLAVHLRAICDGEGVEISDPSLERIARAGEGSVRDSLSVLERLLAFCGSEIDDEEVLRTLGGVKFEVLRATIEAISRRETGVMLRVLDGLVDEGHDLLHFWNELISALRDLMLLRAVPEADAPLSRPAEEASTLASTAAELSDQDLSRVFQILADLEPTLKSSSQPRFMFESALVRLGSLGAVRPIEEVLRAMQEGTRPELPKRVEQKKNVPDAERPAAARVAADSGDVGQRLISDFSRSKPMIGAILSEARSIRIVDDRLELVLPAGREALRVQLERSDAHRALTERAARLAGRPVRVRIRCDDGSATGETEPPAPPERSTAPGGAKAEADAPSESATTTNLLEQATSEPGVRKLLREFGAQVIDIQPFEPKKKRSPARRRPRNLEESP